MEGDKELAIEDAFSPENVDVDKLYDKVVGYLTSYDDDCFCPNMYDVACEPVLMKLDGVARAVKMLIQFVPKLSEEKKHHLGKLANKVQYFVAVCITSRFELVEYADFNVLDAVDAFYHERLWIIDELNNALVP